MAEDIHSEECKKYQAAREASRAEWAGRWPRYCRTCEGWGGFASSYDPSPSGVALSSGSLPDWDECEACTAKGICGRCGAPNPVDEETLEVSPCSSCGWNTDDGMPEHDGDCGCWYEEEKRLLERYPELR